MLLLLSIGYTNSKNDIYYKFTQLCSYLKEKRIDTAIVENMVGRVNYIKCFLKDTEDNVELFNKCKEFFYAYASSIIYEFISTEYEEENIKKIVRENYYYLEDKEKNEIIKRCNALILGKGIAGNSGLMASISCKNLIIKKIQNYLDESKEINIDGFVCLRFSLYWIFLTAFVVYILQPLVSIMFYNYFDLISNISPLFIGYILIDFVMTTSSLNINYKAKD